MKGQASTGGWLVNGKSEEGRGDTGSRALQGCQEFHHLAQRLLEQDAGGNLLLILLRDGPGNNQGDMSQILLDAGEELLEVETGGMRGHMDVHEIRLFDLDQVFDVFERYVGAEVDDPGSPAFEQVVHIQ